MKKTIYNPNMSFDEWEKKYKPISGTFEAGDIRDRKPNPLTVWTYGTGDFGGLYIWNDWRTIGRICYYITEIPYGKNDFILVVIEKAPDVPVNFWTPENLIGEINEEK